MLFAHRRHGLVKHVGPHVCQATTMAEWLAALRDQAALPLTANRTMGSLGNIVASRIAREFRFAGPSHTLSAEECSGIVALTAGVRALQAGELRQALVGAVDFPGDIRAWLASWRILLG